MDSSTISSRFRQPPFLLWTLLLAIVLQGGLIAAPSVVQTNFEEVFGTESILSGPLGGSTVTIIVSYSNDVLRSTIGEGDLVCEGTSPETIGKTIPIKFDLAYRSFSPLLENGRYILGPFDATANGTYSLKVVKDEVTTSGGSPESVPEGEILLFTQDVHFPAPAILEPIRFDPPLTGEDLEGPLGFERPRLIIDFNTDVQGFSVDSSDLEIVGVGSAEGVTIPLSVDYPIDELEDKTTVAFILGPLDVANNGDYKVSIVDQGIRGVGDPETFVPGGVIATYTQDITNPPPRILTELSGFPLPEELPPALDYQGYTVQIYFNYVVDTDEIDKNDLRIVGKSESNEGKELFVESVWANAFNSPLNDAYVIANYYVVGEEDPEDPIGYRLLEEALNGDWEVQIVEGEILDRENPPRALPPGDFGTFNQEVVDPFRYSVKGRVYEDDRENPSLTDDGDPGLFVEVRLEQFQGAGITAAYQDIYLSDTTRDSFPTCLVFPITAAVSGAASSGSFTVSGDLLSHFQIGDKIEVVGSTGGADNGPYTVASVENDWETGITVLGVEEEVPSGVGDGSITKEFKAEVTIDGAPPIELSILGTDVPTFGELLPRINTLLGDAGSIRYAGFDQERLRIESATVGDSSSLLITEPDERAALFSTLAKGFSPFDLPVPGGDGLLPGYHDVGLWSSFFDEDPTGLAHPITQVVMGEAGSGSFTIDGDRTQSFQAEDTFSVVDSDSEGSMGNNGTYTVTSSTFQFSRTTIEVAEAVPSAEVKGTITREYTANVNVDGNINLLTFNGIDVQTFGSLFAEIETALGSSASFKLADDFTIRIQSASQGDSSTVIISETEEGAGLFTSLGTFGQFYSPVRGSDEITQGYQRVDFRSNALLSEPSGLVSFPVLAADSIGSFTIEGDQTGPIQWFDESSVPFAPGDVISIRDSSGNNGEYTVKTVSLVEGNTVLEVSETVQNSAAEGTITKIYDGEMIIDGERIQLSILGSKVPTFADFVIELNNQLDGRGTATMFDSDSEIIITSPTDGPSSSVFVIENQTRTDMFFNLLYGGNPDEPVRGGDGWGLASWNNGFNEFPWFSEEDDGNFQFTITEPGQYRLRATGGEFWDPETQFNDLIDPIPEYVEQALGDPSREGAPLDHRMYFEVTRDMDGGMETINFSYFEENESPEAVEDDAEFDLAFQVPSNSVEFKLDVLKNDTVNGAPPQPGDLTIIGLSPGFQISTDTISKGSREFSRITTDGEFVYYTPYSGFAGWELFHYTIEDKDGNRDLTEVYIFVTAGPIETQLFILDDRFEIPPNSTDNNLNVLGNDFVYPTGNNSALSITGLGVNSGSTSTSAVASKGGTITTTDNRSVIYTPVAGFEGSEFFYYDVSDGDGNTGFAQVIVSVLSGEPQLDPVIGNYSTELARLMSQTAQGRRYLDLFEKYIPEFYDILVGNPEIGGQIASLAERLGLGIQTNATGDRIRLAVDVGSGGEVLKTFEALQDGVAAFLSGQGSESTLTQDIINQTVILRDLIYEDASDEMKADIDAELGNLESKVGQDFDQFFEAFGIDSDDVSLIVFNPFRGESEFLVTVNNLDGFNYTLWKTKTLRSDDWAVVEDATIQYFPTRAVITDPNPGDGQTFYRLQREIETGE